MLQDSKKVFSSELCRILHLSDDMDIYSPWSIEEYWWVPPNLWTLLLYTNSLNAANTPLYGSCKLETRSVRSAVVQNTSNTSTYTSICVGDKLHIGSKHVTHRLEIRFEYARHYIDVFRLMSNVQVTCVNVCQRSHNLRTTSGPRMRDVWAIRWHTSKIFVHAQKFSTNSPYYDVYQRASACS